MKLSPFTTIAAFLSAIIVSATSLNCTGSKCDTLSIPPVSKAASPLPPGFISLSLEFQFFPNFTGTFANPNDFSIGLLRGLANAGDPLFIRVGGSSEDRVFYNKSFELPVQSTFTNWWESNPIRGVMGPSFYDGFSLLPSNFHYVFGVNAGGFNNSQGVHSMKITLDNINRQAKSVWKAIGNRLWAIEPGNEVSGFASGYEGVHWRNATQPWNLTIFVNTTFNATYDLLQGTVLPGDPTSDQSANPLWRAGDLSGFKEGWTFDEEWQTGQNAYHRLREFSIHNYPKTMCSASLGAAVTIENTMLNHDVLSRTLETMRGQAEYTAAQGVEFVLGETNSVSCSGKPAVSDSYAAALWTFDWALYAATVGLKRIYYHQGPGFPYASIWPTPFNGTQPSVRGGYYGLMMGAKAFGRTLQGTSGKRVVNLLNETNLAAYALYTSNKPRWANQKWYKNFEVQNVVKAKQAAAAVATEWHATDVAILNMRPFNQSTPQNLRNNLTVPLGKEWHGATVTRLTAAGSDVLPITHGKAPYLESHKDEGVISVGCMTYVSGEPKRVAGCKSEVVKKGAVVIMDSEAVLISRPYQAHS